MQICISMLNPVQFLVRNTMQNINLWRKLVCICKTGKYVCIFKKYSLQKNIEEIVLWGMIFRSNKNTYSNGKRVPRIKKNITFTARPPYRQTQFLKKKCYRYYMYNARAYNNTYLYYIYSAHRNDILAWLIEKSINSSSKLCHAACQFVSIAVRIYTVPVRIRTHTHTHTYTPPHVHWGNVIKKRKNFGVGSSSVANGEKIEDSKHIPSAAGTFNGNCNNFTGA